MLVVQEKSSKPFNLASNTVRWTMGPNGTVVTFSDDIGLPSIFQTMPNRYIFTSLNLARFNLLILLSLIFFVTFLVLDMLWKLHFCNDYVMNCFSYPPPREKCAGPNCTNAYKYRDSKSKLPLCSLGCYKAIHEKISPVIAC